MSISGVGLKFYQNNVATMNIIALESHHNI